MRGRVLRKAESNVKRSGEEQRAELIVMKEQRDGQKRVKSRTKGEEKHRIEY